MLELICHHTYDAWGGLPIDHRKYGLSSGPASNADFHRDGATPGSGALSFEPGQRVLVPPSEAWQDLGALRVEVLASPRFLNPIPTTPRFLVVADRSFGFAINFPSMAAAIVGTSGMADRATQIWWRSRADSRGFDGRWGQAVTHDPNFRRSGMRLPNFWLMFMLALARGQ